MKEFDFRKAHREWAFPQWEMLSDEIRALYRDVQAAYDGTHQLKDLSMPWLEGFPEKFAAIPDEELVHAQMVIHNLGHWDSKDSHDLLFPRDKHGGYWKFEHLAKQSLVARGYCSPQAKNWPKPPTEQFMVHKEGTEFDNEELADLARPLVDDFYFEVVRVDQCNYRVKGLPDSEGHPFVIGRKHIANSHTMFLDPRCAPCDHCGRQYDDHTSEKALLLKLKNSHVPDEDGVIQLVPEEQEVLKGLKAYIDEHHIAGIGLVK